MTLRVKWENLRGDQFAGVVEEIDYDDFIVRCDDGQQRAVNYQYAVTDEAEPKRFEFPKVSGRLIAS